MVCAGRLQRPPTWPVAHPEALHNARRPGATDGEPHHLWVHGPVPLKVQTPLIHAETHQVSD